MRYFPKHGFGFELAHLDVAALDEFESSVQALRESGEDDAADELETQGPTGPWNAEILATIRDWSGDIYDDVIFDAINTWHEVVPMRIGELSDECGGEISGVSGFEQGTDYLIFDLREQDADSWKQFKAHLEEHEIPVIEGSWSQLG